MKEEFQLYNPYLCPRCNHFTIDFELLSKGKWRQMGDCKATGQQIREDPDYGLRKAPPSCDYFDRRSK